MNDILSDMKVTTSSIRNLMGSKYTIINKHSGRLYEAVLNSVVLKSVNDLHKFTEHMAKKDVRTNFDYLCEGNNLIPVLYAHSDEEADKLAQEAIRANWRVIGYED
ncbi:hypothetical protein EPN87_02200 [archaeon]|nr:MAG: hypothetical protein EPN87_02200 [archaeon]